MKYNDWLTEEVLKALLEANTTTAPPPMAYPRGASASANGHYTPDAQKFKGKLPDEEDNIHDDDPNAEDLLLGKKLSEAEGGLGKDRSKLLELFKLQISENWGKLDTVERAELSRVVLTATKGQTTVEGRLRVIEEQMTMLREGTLGKIKNPRRILSQIILLETFNRLFKSFQPSPAGFINEGLLSVFYGSTQEDAGEANKQFQIGDVIDTDGSPISIKTKVDGNAQVDGSIKNLYHSLNGSKTGKVYFDIFLKKSDGKKDVGSLSFIRFVVDSSNINSFLDLDLFDKNPKNPKMVVLKPEYQDTFLASSEVNEASRGIAGTGVTTAEAIRRFQQLALQGEYKDVEIGMPHIQEMFGISEKNLFNFVNTLMSSKQFRQGVVMAKDDNNPESTEKIPIGLPDETSADLYEKYVQDIGRIRRSLMGKNKIPHDKKTGKIQTHFDLSQGVWEAFAYDQGISKPIVLTFDDESIERTIEAAVRDIDAAITDMFNSLATFTETVQTYLTTIASNRAMIGEKATTEANELPAKTEAVVDVAGTTSSPEET